MSELNFTSIYRGVRLALQAEFPENQIYGEFLEQELEPGAFNVVVSTAGHSKEVGARYRSAMTLDVTYSPRAGTAECCDIAQQVILALGSVVLPEGDMLHCTSCQWEMRERVLHVMVSYTYRSYIPQEETVMESLQIR